MPEASTEVPPLKTRCGNLVEQAPPSKTNHRHSSKYEWRYVPLHHHHHHHRSHRSSEFSLAGEQRNASRISETTFHTATSDVRADSITSCYYDAREEDETFSESESEYFSSLEFPQGCSRWLAARRFRVSKAVQTSNTKIDDAGFFSSSSSSDDPPLFAAPSTSQISEEEEESLHRQPSEIAWSGTNKCEDEGSEEASDETVRFVTTSPDSQPGRSPLSDPSLANEQCKYSGRGSESSSGRSGETIVSILQTMQCKMQSLKRDFVIEPATAVAQKLGHDRSNRKTNTPKDLESCVEEDDLFLEVVDRKKNGAKKSEPSQSEIRIDESLPYEQLSRLKRQIDEAMRLHHHHRQQLEKSDNAVSENSQRVVELDGAPADEKKKIRRGGRSKSRRVKNSSVSRRPRRHERNRRK